MKASCVAFNLAVHFPMFFFYTVRCIDTMVSFTLENGVPDLRLLYTLYVFGIGLFVCLYCASALDTCTIKRHALICNCSLLMY